MTIGDVLAVIAAVFLIGATWIATILLTALAFSAKCARARQAIMDAPGACLARGLGVCALFALAAAVMAHPGPRGLVSALIWAGLGLLAAVGSAGIATLVGERISSVGSAMTPFAALTRGTLLYVAAGFLPIVGFFLVTPIALLLSVGAAVAALRREAPQKVFGREEQGAHRAPLQEPDVQGL